MITFLIIICLFLAFSNGVAFFAVVLVIRDAMRQRKRADEAEGILLDYISQPLPVISDVGGMVGGVYHADGRNILFYDN